MGFWGFMVGRTRCLRLMQSLDRSWGARMWCQATKLYFLDSDAFRWWAHLPNSSSELVKHVALWDEKLLRWAMKPGECITLRGHHDDRIMHQAGVTNALRDGVRLKLIQLLGKPGHINDDKSERTCCYLPWLFLSSENSYVR